MPYRKTQLGATARPLALAQNPDAPDLHFHDLRGTAATKFYIGGLSVRVIAEVMAWEEETVEKIIRRYVGRQAATKALIAQLNESRKRT
jgi:integrase